MSSKTWKGLVVDDPTEPTEEAVSLTALAVASGRAVESSRPDALINDPYAARLVAAAQSTVEFPVTWPDSLDDVPPVRRPLLLASLYIGLRTRFVDDVLAGADVAGGGDPLLPIDLPRQVVVLGAGLDTRAFRLDWPGRTEVFELDQMSVLLFRRDVLRGLGAEPRCEWFAVPTDLSRPWVAALVAAGFDRRRRTSWVIDGLLPYLSADAQLEAINTVARLSWPGSRAVIERVVGLQDSPELEEKLREFGVQTGLPMAGLLARAHPPDPAAILQGRGWDVQQHTMDDLAVRYGRRLDDTPLAGPWVAAGAGAPGAGAAQDDAVTRLDPATPGGFITAQLP